MRQLRGKRALITGAASGIGRAIALRLAAEGTHVYLLDVAEVPLQEVAAEAQRRGVEAVAVKCDLTKPEEITGTLAEMLRRWGALDLLVNNAGVAYYGPTTNMSAEQWDWLMSINLLAPLQITRELLPTLLARDEAHILNVCSISGLVAGGRFAAYHVSKFGLIGFTEALRAEYVRRGLGVTALCPGPVRTNLYKSAASGRAKPVPEPPGWLACTPERCAQKAIAGIRRNRAMVLVTPLAYALYYTKRIAPGLLDLINRASRKRRKQPAPMAGAPPAPHFHSAPVGQTSTRQ
jgi:short-subunit dehydrogenase